MRQRPVFRGGMAETRLCGRCVFVGVVVDMWKSVPEGMVASAMSWKKVTVMAESVVIGERK